MIAADVMPVKVLNYYYCHKGYYGPPVTLLTQLRPNQFFVFHTTCDITSKYKYLSPGITLN